jgi:hypothetical protein
VTGGSVETTVVSAEAREDELDGQVTFGSRPLIPPLTRFPTRRSMASAQLKQASSPGRCKNLLDPCIPPRRLAGVGPRPPPNIARGPEIARSSAVDRRREVRLTAQLVGTLLAHTQKFGDINDS